MNKKIQALILNFKDRKNIRTLEALYLSPRGKYFLNYLKNQLNETGDFIQAYEELISEFQNKLNLDRRKTIEVYESIYEYIDKNSKKL